VQRLPSVSKGPLLRAMSKARASPAVTYSRRHAHFLLFRLKKHTEANQILTTQLKASRTRSERILNGGPSSSRSLDADRAISARVSQLATQNALLAEEVQRQREAGKEKTQTLRARKEAVLQRRKALALAAANHGQKRNLVAEIEETRRATLLLGQRLRHARRVLVLETIDIFGVKRAPKEDPKGKGKMVAHDWEIVGLTMPPPERFIGGFVSAAVSRSAADRQTEYTSGHINAVFEHLVHLLVTITEYLDIVLPFTPQWQGIASASDDAIASTSFTPQTRMQTPTRSNTRHIGRIHLSASQTLPFIRSSQNTVALATHDVTTPPTLQKRALLHVSSSREKWKRRQRKHPDQTPLPSSEITTARGTRDKHREKEDHLNLAYTLLLLDVLYIAETQGVMWFKDTPRARSTKEGGATGPLVSPLRLIDDLRWSEGLGR
jgi:hypothetical protein